MVARRVPFWGLLLFMSLTYINPAFPQIRSAVIGGGVVDPSGDPVPDAHVAVVAQETNARNETKTNSVGQFTVPYLPPGQYTVVVTVQGFATTRLTDISLGTAQTVRADVKLSFSTVETAVEVRANAVELQTESATVQNAVEEKLIEAIPNVTRNPFYYALLQPGAAPRAEMNDTQSARSFGIGESSRRQFSAISINGGMTSDADVVLDGISVQGATYNQTIVLPNTEGVQEVRTLVNNYSAEFGRAQGVITMTTKSGSNQYHGSTFYRLRNEAFNANGFENNARGIARPPFKVNSYGGTFGGPIKKDKAFFFVSYEGLKHSTAVDYLKTVPTALERKGDFSQTLLNVDGNPRSLKLFDPFSAVEVQPNVYQRPPIPNAIIPNPNPFAVKMFSFYPLPNRTPQDVYNTNNYFLRGTRAFNKNSINSRLDYRWGKHSFYGTGGIFLGNIDSTPSWGEAGRPFHAKQGSGTTLDDGILLHDRNPYAALGDTVVLTPTLILDFRYGIARAAGIDQNEAIPNFNYDQFGIPKAIQAINPVPGGPPESGWGGNWSPLQTSRNKKQFLTNHDLVGSLTKTVNRWTLKSGGEYRVYLSNFFAGNGTITYGSSNDFTREIIDASGGGVGVATPDMAGYGPASLLLGAGTLTVQPASSLVRPTFASKYLAFYSQNDWRATPRLTVNLGLRWDFQPGPTDRYNNFCAFDAGGKNPFDGKGAYACAGVGGNPRNLWDNHYKDFGPRSGLAYRVTDTLVIRAGYGLSYLPSNTGFRSTPTVWGTDTFQPFTNSNPYGPRPAGVVVGRFNEVNTIVPATGSDLTAPGTYGGNGINRFPRHGFLNQRSQQWNLFVEKRFGSSWLLSAGYSGSKGSHLLQTRFILQSAQLVPQPLLDSWRQGYIDSNGRSDPGSVQIPNSLQPANGPLIPFFGDYGRATVSQLEANLPYPLFANLRRSFTDGWSNYHSLVLQVNRRFSNGLLVNAHYTWSKSLDFTQSETEADEFFDSGTLQGVQDLRNYRNNYGPSLFDIPHRAVISYLYELPFGAGKSLKVGNPELDRHRLENRWSVDTPERSAHSGHWSNQWRVKRPA